jgi:hypothetical protein
MSIPSFKALIYCLRNCFDEKILIGQRAFPNPEDLGVKWYLDRKLDFIQFHKTMEILYV